METLKACSKCDLYKPLSSFHKEGSVKCGLRSSCKSCDNKRVKKWAESKKLPPRIVQSVSDFVHVDYNTLTRKEVIAIKDKIYRIKNRNYINARRNNNELLLLKSRIRARMYNAFKRRSWKKGGRTEEFIGASYSDVKQHIESLFKEPMSWDNRGKWHIDHIIPLSSAKTKEELIKLCHYTNLQPLWAKDNIIKGGIRN